MNINFKVDQNEVHLILHGLRLMVTSDPWAHSPLTANAKKLYDRLANEHTNEIIDLNTEDKKFLEDLKVKWEAPD